jgi:tubulin epsilon
MRLDRIDGPNRPNSIQTQFITDVSGAGNNFAHGHHVYGPQYGDRVLEAVREAAELCDSLQSFFLMHSLGGGTGSGLGTYVLGLLEDEFPDVHRFVSAVFPSPDDDVVTSPYNSMLALHQVPQYAGAALHGLELTVE